MDNHSESVRQKLACTPGVQKVPSPRIELFQLRNFLDAATCDQLIALIDRNLRPSTIADANGDAQFRTSATGDLPDDCDAVRLLESKLAAVAGIDRALGEPVQGQRYMVGQEFKPHTDYFEPAGLDYHRYCAVAGQRTWTFMIYLNAVEAGGATRFKAIGKTIQPEVGKLLAWNNLDAAGHANPDTVHHGMKVRAGTKYVITRWYRQRPWAG